MEDCEHKTKDNACDWLHEPKCSGEEKCIIFQMFGPNQGRCTRVDGELVYKDAYKRKLIRGGC